ncbi:hypothetical protein NE237_014744 [Protea cynaroides]|uniref:HSF-type DNA-binding domain-containing protein n=1 Tax=Protea cynaroides TaxID=273540 RepID=A0A9Q0KCJ4_9MAGN|nr:hypothetical protein NE237_014744 [Protea cynaroides]
MEDLNETRLPHFLTKTFDIVDDRSTNHVVSWSTAGNSFVIRDPRIFSMILAPTCLKLNNLSCFVTQLYNHGFTRIGPGKLEFGSKGFLRGQKHLLKDIIQELAQKMDMEKKQKAIDRGPRNVVEVGESSQSGTEQNPINVEPEDIGDLPEFEASERETIAMQMQGSSEPNNKKKKEEEKKGTELEGEEVKAPDEKSWEDFWNDDFFDLGVL